MAATRLDRGIGARPTTRRADGDRLIARVLDQLSLSAWLPSVALVLLVVFAIRLGIVPEGKPRHRASLDAIGAAFAALGRVLHLRSGITLTRKQAELIRQVNWLDFALTIPRAGA